MNKLAKSMGRQTVCPKCKTLEATSYPVIDSSSERPFDVKWMVVDCVRCGLNPFHYVTTSFPDLMIAPISDERLRSSITMDCMKQLVEMD